MHCSICNERFRPTDIRDCQIVCEVNHRRCSDQRGSPKNHLNQHQIPLEIIATHFNSTLEWHQLLRLRHRLIKSCFKILKSLHNYQESIRRDAVSEGSTLQMVDLLGRGSLGDIIFQLKKNDKSFKNVINLQTSINRHLEEKNLAIDFMRQRIVNMEDECNRLRQTIREMSETNCQLEDNLYKLSQTKKKRRFARLQASIKQDLIHRYSKQCFIVERVQSWDDVYSTDTNYFYPRLVADRVFAKLDKSDAETESVKSTPESMEEMLDVEGEGDGEGEGEGEDEVVSEEEKDDMNLSSTEDSARSSRMSSEAAFERNRALKPLDPEQMKRERVAFNKDYILNIGQQLGVQLIDKDISNFYICHNGNMFVRLSTIQKCDELFQDNGASLRQVQHPCGHKIVLRRLVPLYMYAQILTLVGYRCVYQTDKIYVEPSLSKLKIPIRSQEQIDHLLLKRIRN